MKKRQHMLPCGRVIYFRDYVPADIAKKKSIQDILIRYIDRFEHMTSFYSAGNNFNTWFEKVYSRFTSHLLEHLTEHLLAGNRVYTFQGNMWMIAAKGESERHANWHSDGKTYGVEIRGINGKFGIKLSKRRRKQLENLIKNGKSYHV